MRPDSCRQQIMRPFALSASNSAYSTVYIKGVPLGADCWQRPQTKAEPVVSRRHTPSPGRNRCSHTAHVFSRYKKLIRKSTQQTRAAGDVFLYAPFDPNRLRLRPFGVKRSRFYARPDRASRAECSSTPDKTVRRICLDPY